MSGRLIEVEPMESGWGVSVSRRLCGQFPSSAQAVTFARTLSDEFERHGEGARIRVCFTPASARGD